MANQIVLAWIVDVTNTTFGPTQAATALGAVPLYTNPRTDPVLGQFFGLAVDDDTVDTPSASTARRTLTLNMINGAPPPFPCRPRTSTPPVLPYPLREAVTLPGSFFPSTGSAVVPTTATQIPSLVGGAGGSVIQFLSQQGVFYTVLSLTATAITLTAAYTGVTKNTGAFKEVSAPVTIAAIYSSSDLDTAGVATVPAIPAGSGARTITLMYTDSAGVTGRTATASLTGRRPAAITFVNGNGIISEIENIVIASSGGFANSVGELTLVELSSALPTIRPDATPADFPRLTDEAQLLIQRHLAYLPPSYFALAQQGTSRPQLAGDFFVTTGSKDVPTSVDQTAVLATTNTIEFADQMGTIYTVAAVTPKIVTLTAPYTGIDTNNTGLNNNPGTKGNIGTAVTRKGTGGRRVSPSPAVPPTNDQLAAPLGQFVDPGNAAPPPNPPLSPATMVPPVTASPGPAPNFLSDLFTQTLQLALAGVPIAPQPIVFL